MDEIVIIYESGFHYGVANMIYAAHYKRNKDSRMTLLKHTETRVKSVALFKQLIIEEYVGEVVFFYKLDSVFDPSGDAS